MRAHGFPGDGRDFYTFTYATVLPPPRRDADGSGAAAACTGHDAQPHVDGGGDEEADDGRAAVEAAWAVARRQWLHLQGVSYAARVFCNGVTVPPTDTTRSFAQGTPLPPSGLLPRPHSVLVKCSGRVALD